MTETRSQSVGVQPPIETLPSPTTTIGAMREDRDRLRGDDVRHQAALQHVGTAR